MRMKPLLVLAGLALGMAAVPDPGWAQTGTVTGRVVDARTLQPISSAQVFIAQLGTGALTRDDGRYILVNIPAGTHTVQAQILGYRQGSQQVTVAAGQTATLEFQMAQDALALEEIIVTGVPGGTQRRAVGNAVERVAVADVVNIAPVRSVEQLLSSRMPGVVTSLNSGQVGLDAAPIRIRGVSSMGVGNDPIIYIDGVRMNSATRQMGDSGMASRLNDINPNDIESIEVIKGPAAATLYGTEASNGVIQIITKKGVTGAPTFDASIELGRNWFPNPRETIPMGYDIDPATKQIISAHLWDTELAHNGKPMFQRGPLQNYSLSVRGGTDLIRYYAGVNHGDEEGFVAWNWDKRTSGRVGLTLNASEKLTLNMNGSFFNSRTRSAGANIWGTIVRQQVSTLNNPRRRGFQVLIDAYRDGEEDRIDVDRNTWSFDATYNPVSWLNTRLVLGSDLTNDARTLLTYKEEDAPSGHFGSNGLGRKSIDGAETRLRSVDLAGTAKFGFLGRATSATSAGIQYNNKSILTTSLLGTEFATRPLTTVGSAARTTSSEDFLENTTLGVYLQQQVDWDQRIFLTAAVRADDNSAFGEEFNAAIYPKVSATWVVNEEPFWRWDFVEQFRLRGAWGAAGRQPDIFAARRLYAPATGPNDLPMVTPRTIGNPDLGPERGEELELGLDAAFLGGRLDLAYTQYWKKTRDAIVPTAVAPSLGFPGERMVNVGQISNWGSELSLNAELVNRGPVRWDLNIGAATMHNRVDELGEAGFLVTGQPLARQYHVEGYPLAGLWAVKVLSAEFARGNRGPANLATAMCDAGSDHSIPGLGGRPSGVQVPCSKAPLVYYGRAGDPTWNVNTTSTLTLFNNLQVFATVDVRGGNRMTDQVNLARLTTWANALPALEQKDPILMAQRAIDRRPIGMYNAGFARLREVALNYAFPGALSERIGASRASVSLAARNLALLWQEQTHQDISGEKVIDPEMRGSGNEFGGHSHTQLPPMRQAVVEFKVAF